ncbi:MAG: MFS transporter [Chloroflexi bacterium]|nr:MFS transporter [Chloroflexota bacterium]
MTAIRKLPKIFYGWYLVAASVIIILYTGGIAHFGFTAVFESISNEFGWSYAQISLAASLRGFETGLLSPAVGILVDRWGPRRLIFFGSIIIALGFLLLSRVTSLGMYYLAFIVIALGMSTCTGVVLMAAVANWFRRNAGLATGLVASGFGLGGLLVPVVTALIDTYQWRQAMVIVGLGTLPIVLPLSLMIRHKPEKYGYQPDGDTRETTVNSDGTNQPEVSEEVNVPMKEVLKGRAFWQIAVSSACHSFVVGAVVTHMMPYLSSVSISRSMSGLVALVLPLASIGGRLSSGWLGDRFGSRTVFTASFFFMMAGLFLFGYSSAERMWLLAPFVIIFSLGWGASVTSRITLLRRYFGRGNIGKVLGFNSGIMMLGNVSGAPLAGWAYDTWGSYQGAWLSFAILTLVGAALVTTLPKSGSAEAPLQ